eukprot:6491368-Amphidinium_carterae.3
MKNTFAQAGMERGSAIRTSGIIMASEDFEYVGDERHRPTRLGWMPTHKYKHQLRNGSAEKYLKELLKFTA